MTLVQKEKIGTPYLSFSGYHPKKKEMIKASYTTRHIVIRIDPTKVKCLIVSFLNGIIFANLAKWVDSNCTVRQKKQKELGSMLNLNKRYLLFVQVAFTSI